MYNMFNGSSCEAMSNLFIKTCNVHCRYTRSATINFFVKQCNTTLHQQLLTITGVHLWNNLPNS